MSAPELVVVGNLVVDDIVLPQDAGSVGQLRLGQAGGATLFSSLAASLWGVRVGLVSRVGDDYPRATLESLRARNVDLEGLRAMGRRGARMWLLYEATGRHIVSHMNTPTHEEASPVFADIPEDYLGARGFLVAPMPLGVQIGVVKGLSEAGVPLIAVDPFTPLTMGNLAEWRELLRHVDILFLGPDELEVGREGLLGLMRGFGERLKVLVVKGGASGGNLYMLKNRTEERWEAGQWKVVDPTGAGDSFAGGFLAEMVRAGEIREGLSKGVVSASFAIEEWGSSKLEAATIEEALRRKQYLARSKG